MNTFLHHLQVAMQINAFAQSLKFAKIQHLFRSHITSKAVQHTVEHLTV